VLGREPRFKHEQGSPSGRRMATGTDSSSAPGEVSLVRGGPFYRVQHALGLIRPNEWNLGRRITFLIAIGWLP
jgi:hypothetical protein